MITIILNATVVIDRGKGTGKRKRLKWRNKENNYDKVGSCDHKNAIRDKDGVDERIVSRTQFHRSNYG